MKVRLIAFLFLLTFLVEVKGFNPGDTATNSIPMGSVTVVSNYCLKTGEGLILYFDQYDTNGIRQPYLKRGKAGTIPSKEIMDTVMTNMLGDGIQELIAHPEYGHDISRPFGLFAVYSSIADVYFECNYNFTLLKVGSTYKAPDLSGAKMTFPNRIPYKLKGITWAHMETTNLIDSTIRIDDSLVGSANVQTISKIGFYRLMIPFADAIGAGTTRGIRINVLNSTNKFEVYVDGIQVVEKQPRIKPTILRPIQISATFKSPMGPYPLTTNRVSTPSFIIPPNQIVLEVSGGEIGRTYSFISSITVNGPYVDTGTRHRVTPTSSSSSITLDATDSSRFFNIKAMDNTFPVY